MSPNLRADQSLFEATHGEFFTFHTSTDAPVQYRLHLRVLPDDSGILIVNAASIQRLNQTGTFFAWAKMQGGTEEDILSRIQKRYQESNAILKTDYRNFEAEILSIINNPDQAPVVTSTSFESDLSPEQSNTPVRVNLCLTYRTDPNNIPPTNEELSTDQWKQVIRKTYDAGIPQILFIGGEPTLREDLVELLTFTEELGLVSGLVTSSQRIIEDEVYLTTINEVGLDHLVLEVDPQITQPEDLQFVFDQDLFTCIRFPVRAGSSLLDWSMNLVKQGANALNFYPADLFANPDVALLNNQLLNNSIRVEHDLPLSFNAKTVNQPHLFSPEIEDPSLDYSYTVLPDGSIRQQVNLNLSLGNIIEQDWGTLLNNTSSSED